MATLENMVEHCEVCGAELEIGQIGKCDSCQGDETMYPKVVVLCRNSEGVPEFYTCAPEVTRRQFDDGAHYDLAKENAADNGYEEPMIAFDKTDAAAAQLGDILTWL